MFHFPDSSPYTSVATEYPIALQYYFMGALIQTFNNGVTHSHKQVLSALLPVCVTSGQKPHYTTERIDIFPVT